MSLLLAAILAAQPVPVASAPPVQAARVIGGYVSDADYPGSASRRRPIGTTATRLLATPQGRVGACQVVRSSGHSILDRQTCKIARRFRFEPARDANGKATAQWMVFAISYQPGGNIKVDSPEPEKSR